MRIALIGAGGARAPLLVKALAGSELGVERLGLYDTDAERLAIMARVAKSYAPGLELALCRKPEDAIEGARFVLTSIRAGGMELRARDEESAIGLGLLGQETVGAAGFALALRNVPPMLDYARLVERHAPDAWLVNYTNPVGIVCQAMTRETSARVVGVCDTPTELFANVARELGASTDSLVFDYVGLNHLGWLREVLRDGEPQMERLLEDDGALARIYRAPLFSPDFLRELKLLPTEYLYFYYRTPDAVARITEAGRTRGRTLVERNEALFRALAAANEPAAVYERYIEERDRTYFRVEAGSDAEAGPPGQGADADAHGHPNQHEATGYDKIALAVLGALSADTCATIPVNVPNRGTLAELEDDDVIEVPARLDARGIATTRTTLPDAARDWVQRVKHYERLTVLAALEGTHESRRRALASNPLVGDDARAEAWLGL